MEMWEDKKFRKELFKGIKLDVIHIYKKSKDENSFIKELNSLFKKLSKYL
jgi:hypothetical protein